MSIDREMTATEILACVTVGAIAGLTLAICALFGGWMEYIALILAFLGGGIFGALAVALMIERRSDLDPVYGQFDDPERYARYPRRPER